MVCVEIRPLLENIWRGIAINLVRNKSLATSHLKRTALTPTLTPIPTPTAVHLNRCRRGPGLRARRLRRGRSLTERRRGQTRDAAGYYRALRSCSSHGDVAAANGADAPHRAMAMAKRWPAAARPEHDRSGARAQMLQSQRPARRICTLFAYRRTDHVD